MAGESILIVDDTPVNLKLTRILLVNEGYNVLTAASAEEALEVLRGHRPRLILADIQLPGMDGLEMTRRIKHDPATRHITVIALTAFAMKGDEQKAMEAGCDGYITKPIDTRTLGKRIREYLNVRFAASEPALSDAPMQGIPASELSLLRRRFLDEGLERSRQLLMDLDSSFNSAAAANAVHQWVGTGGLLGYSAIGVLAREVEALLRERPMDGAQVRESLNHMVLAFSSQGEARDAPVPASILEALAGKCVGIVGLPTDESQRLCVALERAQARPVFFEIAAAPNVAVAAGCDLVAIYVRTDFIGSPWLNPASAAAGLPAVFVGAREHLLALDSAVQAMAREFLMDSWQPDEALIRLSVAIAPAKFPPPSAASPAAGRPRVLIADDDPTVLALVRMALENFGFECHQAIDGASAIEAARRLTPQAVVLDVNMPGMDGYAVLSAIRGDLLSTRVLLLTARRQEKDIIRGFALGADDYVVKPFSPLELVARLRRLLAR